MGDEPRRDEAAARALARLLSDSDSAGPCHEAFEFSGTESELPRGFARPA